MSNTQTFFTETLPAKLTEQPDVAEEINDTIQFDIEGAGTWTLDLTEAPGSVKEGGIDEAGCVVSCAAEDFESMLDNPAGAMSLFVNGKIVISNMGLLFPLYNKIFQGE